MLQQLKPALMLLLVMTVITGLVYPLAVTGIAQLVFHHQANGSLVERDGRGVGSALIGQTFTGAAYFWGRPSATAPSYDGGASTGSNLGPSSSALHERLAATVQALREANGYGRIPVDLATASGSGLDPHISPAGALYQARRVARFRGVDEATVRRLVDDAQAGRPARLL